MTVCAKQHGSLYEGRVEVHNKKLRALEELPVSIRISQDEEKPFDFTTIEQDTLLESLDHIWNQHLHEMDQLREGIGLRGYGQKNPKHEYQREGFLLFQQMIAELKQTVVRKLFYYELPEANELMAHIQAEEERRRQVEQQMKMVHANPGGGSGDSSDEESEGDFEDPKDPNSERKRLQEQRKKRRKKKK